MKVPRVPELSALAHKIESLNFITSLSSEEETSLKVRLFQRLHGVAYLGGTYHVRLSIGGSPFTLAITKSGAKAARFADMAQTIFWKYRVRKCRPPKAGELNISVGRAAADLEHELLLSDVLREQENLLLAKKLITIRDSIGEKRTQSKSLLAISQLGERVINTQTDIRGLNTRLECVIAADDLLRSRFEELQSAVLDIQKQQGLIVTILSRLVDRLNGPATIQGIPMSGVASNSATVLGSLKLNI